MVKIIKINTEWTPIQSDSWKFFFHFELPQMGSRKFLRKFSECGMVLFMNIKFWILDIRQISICKCYWLHSDKMGMVFLSGIFALTGRARFAFIFPTSSQEYRLKKWWEKRAGNIYLNVDTQHRTEIIILSFSRAFSQLIAIAIEYNRHKWAQSLHTRLSTSMMCPNHLWVLYVSSRHVEAVFVNRLKQVSN